MARRFRSSSIRTGGGGELAPSQIQKGHTIAILYAQRHAFKFSERGIRHEKPKDIKVHEGSYALIGIVKGLVILLLCVMLELIAICLMGNAIDRQ